MTRLVYNDAPVTEGIDGQFQEYWNKLHIADYLWGRSDKPSFQNPPSNGHGYPKLQDDPSGFLRTAGLASAGFTTTDLGQLSQSGFLPARVITAATPDLNPGLEAMLIFFQDSLTLDSATPRSYWFYTDDIDPPETNKTGEIWGWVNAYAYRWTNPGLVDTPVSAITTETEELKTRLRLTTPNAWPSGGLELDDSFMNYQEEFTVAQSGLELRRLASSLFWLIEKPDPCDAEFSDADKWGKIFLYDYELTMTPGTNEAVANYGGWAL